MADNRYRLNAVSGSWAGWLVGWLVGWCGGGGREEGLVCSVLVVAAAATEAKNSWYSRISSFCITSPYFLSIILLLVYPMLYLAVLQ